MSILKRFVAATLAAAMLFALAGCQSGGGSSSTAGGSSSGAAGAESTGGEEKVLNIFTYATYFPDDILQEFTEQTGIQINYTTFESNEEMLMKLQAAGGGSYDIVLAGDYIIDMARQEGLISKLDKSKIPNFGNIDPKFQSKYYDETNEYTVPYAAGIPFIIYNPDLVGDVEINGYEDLWNPALADSLVLLDDARMIIGMTLKTMGESFNVEDPAVLEQAKEKLLQLGPNIRALDYSTPYNLMISGETAAGYMFTSQIVTCQNENENFRVVAPEEGLGFGIDSCFIPSQAPHKDNAHQFLNFILDGERSAHISEQILYINCVKAAEPYITNPSLLITDEMIENGEFIMPVDTADLYNDIWTEFKQSLS